MNLFGRKLVFGAVLLAGCGTTRDVAVTSYHVTRGAAVGSYKVARAVAVGSYRVASAPVRYATRKRGDEPTMVGTTEASASDVSEPGQPLPAPEIASAPQRQTDIEAGQRQNRRSGSSQLTSRDEAAQSSRVPSARTSAPTPSFPTGKPVPGKPGYVFSPFDPSEKYVDVSGFAPGTKVKDPWTDKIFIVP
jgi:hypothetical protein